MGTPTEGVQYRSPEVIHGDILQRRDITVTAKRVYEQIRLSQASGRSVSLSMGWIASRLNVSRQAVSRAAELLCERNLLDIHHQSSHGTIFSILKTGLPKKFFLSCNSNNSGHCWSMMLLYTYIKFRQGQNDKAWPHLITIAEDLGLSKASVCRLLGALEREGYIKVDHCNGGRLQGNRYQITGKPFFVIQLDSKPQSGVSKHDTYNNTSFEVKENHTPESSIEQNFIKKQGLLRENGVAYHVARSSATKHTERNVENAVINAVCQEQLKQQQGVKFNRAAYIVGILNKSAKTGLKVQLNLFAAKEVENFRRLQSTRTSDLPMSRAMDIAKKSQILADLTRRQEELANGTAKRNVSDSIRRMLGVA